MFSKNFRSLGLWYPHLSLLLTRNSLFCVQKFKKIQNHYGLLFVFLEIGERCQNLVKTKNFYICSFSRYFFSKTLTRAKMLACYLIFFVKNAKRY